MRGHFVLATLAAFAAALATPSPVHAWGAIAISQGDGSAWSYGLSVGHVSQQDARVEAMRLCRRERNGYNCRIVTTFNQQCAAVAFNTRGNGFGWATRPSAGQAQGAAHNSCLDSNRSCRVAATRCD